MQIIKSRQSDHSVSVFVPQLIKLFSENLLIQIDSPDSDLLEGGILDSMKLVELMLSLEQAFGITVSMEDLDIENFRSISRIAGLVERAQSPVNA